MTPSVLLALASLTFAGVNDFIFKQQSIGGGGRGSYMAVAGAVWFAVFAVAAVASGDAAPTTTTLVWGLAAGLFSVSANYLLIGSLRTLGAAVGATIYRMNMVIAAAIGMVFLGEAVTGMKLGGLALGAAAVLLFTAGPRGTVRRVAESALLAAVTASLLRACMGITYKLAAGAGTDARWFLALQGFVWLAAGSAVALRFERSVRLTWSNTRHGLVSGLLICGIVYFFQRALDMGEASIVIPIAQMSFVVTALISRVVLKERLDGRRLAALGLSAASFVLLGLAG